MVKGIERKPELDQAGNVRFIIREMVEAGDFIHLGINPGHIGPYPEEIVGLYATLTGARIFTEQEIGVSVINT